MSDSIFLAPGIQVVMNSFWFDGTQTSVGGPYGNQQRHIHFRQRAVQGWRLADGFASRQQPV
jgi:hypothetical protein